MRRYLLAFTLLAGFALCGGTSRASADEGRVSDDLRASEHAYYDEYDDTESHPIRVAAYVLHPIGYALEWIVFRPFHAFVSLPYVAEAVGHHPHGSKVVY